MPVALNAAVQYSEWMGFQAENWRAEEYVTFVSKFLLGMGLGFEMPVVLLVLVKIGILDYEKLAGFRRYMIIVCLILGAVLTTPEVITQILMAVPLYFFSLSLMATGTIKKKMQDKGFGFIRPDDGSPDVFFHVTALRDGEEIAQGKAVSYELGVDERSGKSKAVSVDLI